MLKSEIVAELKRFNNGSEAMTQKEVAEYLGCSRQTAARILGDLKGVNGTRFLIKDVASAIQQNMR